jgi:hypothetical protein
MKKILSLIVLMVAFVSVSFSQNLTATNTTVYIAKGATADTLNKDGSITYTAYVPNFCYATKFQVTQTEVSGYAKTKTYLETSFDNALWTKLDSVSISETAKGISVLKNPYTQYIRLRTVGLDSTQTTRVKYYWLIEKRP